MVILHKKSALSTQPTLSDIAKDKKFIEAANKISKGQKELLNLFMTLSDILFIFLIMPVFATLAGYIIINKNGKDL